MEFETDRRGFLALAGTGTTLSLAGCNALQDDTPPSTETTTETTAEETPVDTATVGVAIRVDEQTLQQRRQEIRSQLQNGSISRREAQQQFQQVRATLRSQAVTSFTERIRSNDALTLEDTVEQLGAVLISGPANDLIAVLGYATVNVLLPEATFQQAKRQASQQPGTTTSTNSS